MSVRMFRIGRMSCNPYADQTHHIRNPVEEGMEAVGSHGDGIGYIPVDDFRKGNRRVQDQGDNKHPSNACGISFYA